MSISRSMTRVVANRDPGRTTPVNFIREGREPIETRPRESTVIEQRRAIGNAKGDLALRERLDAQINVKQHPWQSTPPGVAKDPAADPRTGTDVLVQEAHRVLVHYLPGGDLPEELWKLRAMLDLHMFGRDKRVRRDDVVQVARQIDRMLA